MIIRQNINWHNFNWMAAGLLLVGFAIIIYFLIIIAKLTAVGVMYLINS